MLQNIEPCANPAYTDISVNGVPVSAYGGKCLLNYTIGGTPLDTETFQGINRTNFEILKKRFGLREIRLEIVFEGPTLHAAKLNRSRFNALLFGKAELYIPDDGFSYTVNCEDTGEETLVGIGEDNAKIKSEYKFTGIRHGELVRISVAEAETFFCDSTMPFTDCRLTVTTTGPTLIMGGANFFQLSAGDVVCFDGIEKKITVNGANWTRYTDWEHFPSLTPGLNGIASNVWPVAVEYYPAYI